MKNLVNRIFNFLATVLVITGAISISALPMAVSAQPFDQSHAAFSALLKKHVVPIDSPPVGLAASPTARNPIHAAARFPPRPDHGNHRHAVQRPHDFIARFVGCLDRLRRVRCAGGRRRCVRSLLGRGGRS